MIKKKKSNPAKRSVPKVKNIVNRHPLVESDGLDHPQFLEKAKSGVFEKDDLEHHIKGGSPIKFKNDFMRQVYFLARLGATGDDIGAFFGVNSRTVDDWKISNPDFREAYLEGHWLFGMKVGETLGQRALGYDYEEVEYSQHLDRFGVAQNLTKVTKKHMPPDVTAIIFYLKNRFKDSWADVNRTELESRVNIDVSKKLQENMEKLSPEEQALIKSIAIKNISENHGISNK